jgi:hypothetical protein
VIPVELLLREWAESLEAAYREAKAARSRELRGRRGRTFDGRGLHPFSLEVGRVQAMETVLSDVIPPEAMLDPLALWRAGRDDAEAAFADDVALRGFEAFRAPA